MKLELTSRKAGVARPPILSIIVPTFNERENVPELVARIRACITCLIGRWCLWTTIPQTARPPFCE